MIKAKGKMIAAMGLPGSGKSSIISKAASIMGAHCFIEPEESKWPDAVHMRDQVGPVTAITWFRSIRVPFLYKADRLRAEGKVAFVDSYYDKLISKYLGKAGMEWLISPSDRYYSIIKELSLIDYDKLPNADCLVSFQVSKERWHAMLSKRDRDLDKNSKLQETFHTQEYFIDAAKEYCEKMSVPHVMFNNETEGVEIASKALLHQLSVAGVLEDYE